MKKTILFAALTVFSSCTINQRILYSTKDIKTNQDQKLSTLVLDIEEFNLGAEQVRQRVEDQVEAQCVKGVARF